MMHDNSAPPGSLRFLFAGLLLLLCLLPVAYGADAGAFKSLSWEPHELESGSACLFSVEFAGAPSQIRGKWIGRDVYFFRSKQANLWYGLAGVDVETDPGSYDLDLDATMPDGRTVHLVRTITVAPANYRTETLRVAGKFVQPNAQTLKHITADQRIKAKAFAHFAAAPEWSGDFVSPVATTLSDGFGVRRTFNGKLASVHRGLDYHARKGTAVAAANSGTVVLAHPLFYEGNCVVIDHGQQFMTLYMHLSKIKVKVGQRVRKGQRLGLSGATGRVTGPHLHLAVRWQGAYLDPEKLLELKLPMLSATTMR